MQYSIRGKVREGKKRGRLLGFPTANINLHLSIPEGIYIAEVVLNKKKYQALVFIGAARTFEEKKVFCEAYIFSFSHNIYGKWLLVRLLKKIRENRKFDSVDQLITQMKKDQQIAEQYFSS